MSKKDVILAAVVAALWVLIAHNIFSLRQRAGKELHTSDVVYDTTTRVDTVRVYKTVARDSVVTRYVVARLAVADTSRVCLDTATVCQDLSRRGTATADSVAVVVPITQKEYGDSTYRAWVSGYRARLDSIEIYQRTVTTTARPTRRQSRWGLGFMAGYGVGRHGLTPMVGVGVVLKVKR